VRLVGRFYDQHITDDKASVTLCDGIASMRGTIWFGHTFSSQLFENERMCFTDEQVDS
jgi:hypothetical protein